MTPLTSIFVSEIILQMQTEILKLLNDIRKQEGLSHSEFAKKIGIPNSTWSLICNGKRQLGVKTIAKILSVYPQLTFAFFPLKENPSANPQLAQWAEEYCRDMGYTEPA